MLVMLVIGIPLYTCASAATPVMATLVLKGLNPGAALVFLLAGPATSLGSITVLLKFLGARVVALYLASIAVMSLLAGFALNWTYQALAIDPRATFGTANRLHSGAAQGRGRAAAARAAPAQPAPHAMCRASGSGCATGSPA